MTGNPLGQIPSATYTKCVYIKQQATPNSVLPTNTGGHACTYRQDTSKFIIIGKCEPKGGGGGGNGRMQKTAQYETTWVTLLAKYYYKNQIKKGKMALACSTDESYE